MNQVPAPAWFRVANVAEIPSPALLVFPERIRQNLRRMLQICPDAARLRPHLKTHKMGEILRLQLEAGITRAKCATPAEAELAARAGMPDVLLAYPVVGPNIERLLRLIAAFPHTAFSVVADDAEGLRLLSSAAQRAHVTLSIFLDVDCGMHRTGVDPGTEAGLEMYRLLASLPGLRAAGLHVYDGHIDMPDPVTRRAEWSSAMANVRAFQAKLQAEGLTVPKVVAGGTPTFPFNAATPEVECSPGTVLLWDAGYSTSYPELNFVPAALVLARVVSRPGAGRLCLDLGYKAVASEKPHPRVQFLELPDATTVAHSEEHLVLETARAFDFPVGTVLHGIPRHICPTVALYDEAVVIEGGRATGTWRVAARERNLHC